MIFVISPSFPCKVVAPLISTMRFYLLKQQSKEINKNRIQESLTLCQGHLNKHLTNLEPNIIFP